jgi:uncharacterized protein YodC (DUF2158 family)
MLTMRLRRAKPSSQVGDVLKLRSGGYPMTATWSGPVLCAPGAWLISQWFSDTSESKQEMVPEETLERASHGALAA